MRALWPKRSRQLSSVCTSYACFSLSSVSQQTRLYGTAGHQVKQQQTGYTVAEAGAVDLPKRLKGTVDELGFGVVKSVNLLKKLTFDTVNLYQDKTVKRKIQASISWVPKERLSITD
ncbi:hypothetical protein A3841_00800 [Pontibacter flavimaris]|uniref:Uncharacterized protein n=1 Tax=Pontibacter flavimaris TaxID=1797110 RepID=A0A1Q5PBF5_9BACT|nr:hypothetical protein A3841_00800 [Pontibacter flavimaris]